MSVDHIIGPASATAGGVIIGELRRGGWSRFTAVVAFARMSGVRHVESRLHAFAASGRTDLTIGVDLWGTSHEAAWYMMNAVEPTGRLLLASAEPGATFHPKVFIFSDAAAGDSNTPRALRAASRAVVVVGSSNLTGGGLYVNDEASTIWRPTLAEAGDAAAWASLIDALTPWLTTSGPPIVGDATPARLRTLALAGRLPQELALAGARGASVPASGGGARRRPPRAPALVGPAPPALHPPPGGSPRGLSVLIARLPFGGSRRWPQWELNTDVLREFFGVTVAGNTIDREGVTRAGMHLPVVSTPLVIGVGRNRRLEFPEPDNRADPAPGAALLVVADRRPGPFRYAVLLPGDAQYTAVEALNQVSPATGQHVPATRRVVVPYARLLSVWPGCPL